MILLCTGGKEPYEIVSWSKSERNVVIRQLQEDGLSIQQIERATGISRSIWQDVDKKERPKPLKK